MSRLIFGARISLLVALAAVALATAIATALVALSRRYGTETAGAGADTLGLLWLPLAFPMAVVWGPSFLLVILVVALALCPRLFWMAQGQALGLKTIAALFTLQIGWALLLEASLSFLGGGIPPPTPAWGGMVAEGRQYLATAYWVFLLPGLALLLLAFSVNLVAQWLRDKYLA